MSDRCLGILGCDRLKLGGCERSLFGDVGVLSFKIRGLCAIAFGDIGCDRLKLGWL